METWPPKKNYQIRCNIKRLYEQQQHGLSDSTPRAGSDKLQKSTKSLLSALQLMSISQKYGSGQFDPFKSQEKFVP